MALNSDKKYLNNENVKDLVKALSFKNATQATILQTNITENRSAIEEEVVRAEGAEATLQTNIDNENTRAIEAETQIQNNLDDVDSALRDTISADKSELQGNIDKEEIARQGEISRIETKYDERLSGLDTALQNYTDSQVNAAIGTLRTELATNKETLDTDIDELTALVNQNKLETVTTFQSVNDRITAEVDNLEEKIVDHNSQYTTLNQQVQSHIENESNPHKVTLSQIGGASQADLDSLEERVTINEELSVDNEERLTTIEPKVEKNISDIEALQTEKVNYNGTDQIISGGLISDGDFTVNGDTLANGDLRVTGNLIVDGTHQTVNTETLQVKDNFIVVNSDNETLGSTPAGIAIQTGTIPYLIAYDIENKSVSLGVGTQSGGTFGFAEGEKKPILTRANSNQLQDKHLLIWDAATNTAIDGGLYDEESLKDTFATWTAYNTLVDEVRDNDEDIANLQAEDIKINANIDQIEAHDTEQDGRLDTAEADIDTLESVKQNIADNTLKTTAKTIPTSINEIHDQLEAHELNKENPHQVKWSQINSDALNNTNPLMDGVASPGTLTTVSRSDHIHPTDISRAPVNHASGSTQYGQATDSLYGHVIVDSNVSDASINPVQNKIIKKYVDDTVAGLDVSAIELSQSETVSSISESDGKISVTKQGIQILEAQVTNLPEDLIAIRNNADRIESESKSRDATLQDNIDTVQSNLDAEVDRATDAENTLQNNINTETQSRILADDSLSETINTTKTYLEEKIDSNTGRIVVLEETVETVKDMNESIQSIQATRTQENYQQRFVLSFEPEFDSANNVTGYKPIFTTMDDGELS